MSEELLQEWLYEFESLDPTQIRSFATEQEHNTEITLGIFSVFEERNKYSQLVDPICSQLFEFYRTREIELQRFTLQFIPVLIRLYLGCVAHGDKRSCRSIETLLIGIYNLEIVDENGQPKVISFRLPSIAQSSIYHEPISLGPSFLTTNVLKRLEDCNSKLVSWGPLQQVESLNAQNRLNVMTSLVFLFNRHLSRINNKVTLEYLCKSILKLITQGFYRPGHVQRSSYGSTDSSTSNNIRSNQTMQPRIPLSSQLLLELLHSLYYAAFNGQEYLANQSIESIHHRACYESFVDVQLLANAIKHSLRLNISSQSIERPMGISIAIGSTTNTPTVSKSMITNASFRIKKLPEDIPIQNKEDANIDGKNLVSITEEHEDDIVTVMSTTTEKTKASKQIKDSVPKSLPKLPTFSGLGKKLKDKDQKQQTDKNQQANKNGVAALSPDSIENQSKNKVIIQKGDGSASSGGKGNRNSITTLTLTDGVNGDVISKKSTSSLNNNNNNGSILVLESMTKNLETTTTEKVSLVSDSLQEDTSLSVSNDDDSSSLMLEDQNDVSTMIPLMTLQDNDLKSSMQVSSV